MRHTAFFRRKATRVRGPNRAVGEAMPVIDRRWEWFISCAIFAGILIALVVAVLLQDPMSASVP
jgi:hypothetical protein